MIKTTEIIEHQPFYLICKFNNGEVKKLFVEQVLKDFSNPIIAKKILTPSIFNQVQLGELGQILWKDVAEMKDEKGKIIPCEYDMSPEFVYHHAEKI